MKGTGCYRSFLDFSAPVPMHIGSYFPCIKTKKVTDAEAEHRRYQLQQQGPATQSRYPLFVNAALALTTYVNRYVRDSYEGKLN